MMILVILHGMAIKIYNNFLVNLMTVLVVGSGGNGQTHFMNFLKNNNVKINHDGDSDKLKHLSIPKVDLLKNVKKCIFIYNDPYKSILSHFRRKWQHLQIKKLGNPYKLKSNDIININSYLRLVMSKRIDLFGIKNQFDNWIKCKLDFPILFLDFNEVLEKKELLNKFLGIDLNYDSFEIKERESKIIKNDVVISFYNEIYSYFKEKSIEHNNLNKY